MLTNWLFTLDFALFLLYFAKIARFYQNSPISPISGAQNRRFLAIGDLSPGQKFYRHAWVRNRGFGDKSPEMLTLFVSLVLKLYLFMNENYWDAERLLAESWNWHADLELLFERAKVIGQESIQWTIINQSAYRILNSADLQIQTITSTENF